MRETLWALLGLFLFQTTTAQLPVIKGSSSAHAGMLYYDVAQAKDLRERRYSYTISPDSAACLRLDFTLVESPPDLDFIRVHSGTDNAAPALVELGGQKGSQLFQSDGSPITVEFLRQGPAVQSTWTLSWRSDRLAGCAEGGSRPDDCPDVQEICGPTFTETFHYFDAKGTAKAIEGGCLDRPHHSSWYKFVAARAGQLQFTITPRNGFDDFDWVLWQVPADSAPACPADLGADYQRACNHAGGRGSKGSTGMSPVGRLRESSTLGNPFSSTVPANKGDVFFLLVDDYSQHSQGFQIDFNEVVLDCRNPDRDFLPLDHKPPRTKPMVPKQNQFSRYTRILRIDLDEKANVPLRDCRAEWRAFEALENVKAGEGEGQMAGAGVAGALLTGLKYGYFKAYAAHDHATPVHFGDVLEVAGKEGQWETPNGELDRFNHVLELVVDEIFDRNTGRKKQQIRLVRLVWWRHDLGLPEQNVALFQFPEVAPVLDRMFLPNPHNEAMEISALDFLKGQMYNSINLQQGSKANRTLDEAAFEREREINAEDYRWDH